MRCGHILFFHVSMCCWWWNEMLSRLRWWWNLKCRKLQYKVAVFFECTWSNRSLHLWWTLSFEIVVNSNCNWLMISFIIFIFSTNNMPEPWKFFSPWNSEPTLFLSLSLSLLLSLSFKSDQKKTCLQVEWSLRNGNIFASDKASSKNWNAWKNSDARKIQWKVLMDFD